MKAIDVFSAAIKYLKDHLIASVNNRNSLDVIAVENIRWILTVPAIWDDGAKQFMREAAEMVISIMLPINKGFALFIFRF